MTEPTKEELQAYFARHEDRYVDLYAADLRDAAKEPDFERAWHEAYFKSIARVITGFLIERAIKEELVKLGMDPKVVQ